MTVSLEQAGLPTLKLAAVAAVAAALTAATLGHDDRSEGTVQNVDAAIEALDGDLAAFDLADESTPR